MPLNKLSDEEIREKLHRREEIREIVASRGLTDILRINPQFMRMAEGLSGEEEEIQEASQSKWKKGAKIAKNVIIKAAGSIAGASYMASNAANVAGASNLAYGYFSGGAFGFINSVPNVIEQGKKTAAEWENATNYERYKNVKGMVSRVNGLAGNTRNVIIQGADGFGGVTWNTPGSTVTESGINPAQLETDICFNIINNVLITMGGVEQIYESRQKKKDINKVSTSIKTQQLEGIEGIQDLLEDERIKEIITSLKDPQTKSGKFIPALTKMKGVVEDLHNHAVSEGAPEERLGRLEAVKGYLEDNMAAYEETEKLIRTNAMAIKQANLETACGVYDVVKGSVTTAVVSARFVSGPMGGIAGLVDGVTGVLGAAALKGEFFGLEELWDNKSIYGERNKRRAAAKEVDAAICLCGDRDYDVKSATKQLVQDVIKDYNERNPEAPLPANGDTKRSVASKVYYEMGSVERSKAGLGNNAMLIRAAELRAAALQEPAENGPYQWCIKAMGFKCKDGELPGVDQIAKQMGCNRNWRDLVKQDEIDKKEKKWADKQAQGEEGAVRSEKAKASIEQALESTTEKRKLGRTIFINRTQLDQEEKNIRNDSQSLESAVPKEPQISQTVRPKEKWTYLPQQDQKSSDVSGERKRSESIDSIEARLLSLRLPEVPKHEPGKLSESLSTDLPTAAEARSGSVRRISKEELDEMGVKTGHKNSPKRRQLEPPMMEKEEALEPLTNKFSREEPSRKPIRHRVTRM